MLGLRCWSWPAISLAILLAGCVESSVTASKPQRPVAAITLETLSISEVHLEQDELVIGVSAGGKFRAYLVQALEDTLDRTPAESPLEAPVVTDQLGGIMIRVPRRVDLQTGRLPVPPEVDTMQLTTWGKWKSAHPETDVYLGSLDEG
jgi:hypothetical protein